MNHIVSGLAGLALLGGLAGGLAACGSSAKPVAAPVVHVTVTAQAPKPVPTVTITAKPTPTVTATKTVAPPAPPAPAAPAPYYTNSVSVVTQFYQDITDHDYYDAYYNLGGSNIGGSDYSGWVAGYDTTESISLGEFSAFGSDQVQVILTAPQSDGSVNVYQGTYTVSDGAIVAANIVQTG